MDTLGEAASVERMTTLTAMPASFSAGTTLTYERTLPELPTSTTGWQLSVYLAGPGVAQQLNIAAVANVCTVLISAVDTANLPPGGYQYFERAVEIAPGARVFDIETGTISIEPNLASAIAGSAMTFEAKVLAALKAKLEGRLTTDQETLQVEGTAIARIRFEQLERLIDKYQAIVELQERPDSAIGSIEISFGRTT